MFKKENLSIRTALVLSTVLCSAFTLLISSCQDDDTIDPPQLVTRITERGLNNSEESWQWTYDAQNRIASHTDVGSNVYDYTYIGNTVVITNEGFEWTYTFSSAGRLESLVHEGEGFNLTRTFTYAGNMMTETWVTNGGQPAAVAEYTFDSKGERVVKLVSYDGETTTTVYEYQGDILNPLPVYGYPGFVELSKYLPSKTEFTLGVSKETQTYTYKLNNSNQPVNYTAKVASGGEMTVLLSYSPRK